MSDDDRQRPAAWIVTAVLVILLVLTVLLAVQVLWSSDPPLRVEHGEHPATWPNG